MIMKKISIFARILCAVYVFFSHIIFTLSFICKFAPRTEPYFDRELHRYYNGLIRSIAWDFVRAQRRKKIIRTQYYIGNRRSKATDTKKRVNYF